MKFGSQGVIDPKFDDSGAILIYKEHADPKEVDVVREGIIQEAVKAEMGRMRSFNFFIKDSQSQVIGGIAGYTMYGLLYTDMLWIDSKFRNKKWASKLLQTAEQLGRDRKCKFACLVTMSWQALPLYQKHNYSIEYIREGFDRNAKMYILRKELAV